MGAIVNKQGTSFHLWAPNTQTVSVVGTFNDWDAKANPMKQDENKLWYCHVPNAKIGDQYRFEMKNGKQTLSKIDPYARQVTNSVGNGILCDQAFDWDKKPFKMPPWNELVIYEMHIGTFGMKEDGKPGNFKDAAVRFGHLKRLGVNAIQIMPLAEFAGDISWGYNPSHIFAVESAYGGPCAFKEFIKEAHANGLAVILDVVYNHFGPGDLSLWQFDGWSENNGGGIYFYNDWKSKTPWGNTRPDYGRGEVRQFIKDNVLMWLNEFHIDGLRWDAVVYIRTVDGQLGDKGDELPDGWSLMQWINNEVQSKFPGCLTVAEDIEDTDWLTKKTADKGAGFGSKWDVGFVNVIREAVIQTDDKKRSMTAIRDSIMRRYNGDVFQRVIYSESHDDVANGKARIPHEISPNDPDNWFAQKRSTLAAAVLLTAPGIPMLFEGQEFLQGLWFQDNVPLEWDQDKEFSGIVRMYRDLIHLRLNLRNCTSGLCGQNVNVYHINDNDKVIAIRRWDKSGPGDDVIVVANFANRSHQSYKIGLPAKGKWKVRFNSDFNGYSKDFSNFASHDITSQKSKYDGCEYCGEVGIGPYSVVIFSQ